MASYGNGKAAKEGLDAVEWEFAKCAGVGGSPDSPTWGQPYGPRPRNPHCMWTFGRRERQNGCQNTV